jgi:predicted amidohydrolase
MSRQLTIVLSPDLRPLEHPEGLSGADVVVFPELATGGYARLAQGPVTFTEATAQLSQFRRLSSSVGCTVVAGTIALPDRRQRLTNTSLVFSKGRQIHRYDKVHLFRPCQDHLYFRPGKTMKTFTLPLPGGGRARAGVIICFDLRFPELTRLLALEGMELLCVPARWPQKRDDAWRSLLKARAIESQIFVAGCNATGEEGGASYVFDPSGEELLASHGDPGSSLQRVRLDLGRIADAQALHRNLKEAVVLRALARPRR